MTKSMRPEDHFRLIEKHRITFMLLIPVQITSWMEAMEVMKKYDLGSLKVLISGAQKVKPELVKWCLEKVGVNFQNCFGMAEGPTIYTRWDDPVEAHKNTIGKPIIIHPTVEMKIVNDRNEEVERGEIGEMIMKGPMTFKGYFRNPQENAHVFDEKGFFHSGDLMSQRPDGRFVVEGRKKDMIIRGGENIYPESVEIMLMKHPKVLNAAVIGMPDAKLGERLCAFVQLRETEVLTHEHLRQYMTEQGFAVFQWPERLEVVQGWPLTAVNKIDKRRLRAYITTRLYEEGKIDKALAREFLQRDKFTADDFLLGKVTVDFARNPSRPNSRD